MTARSFMSFFFFFFNDTATTEIYPLSLHDALPIYPSAVSTIACGRTRGQSCPGGHGSTDATCWRGHAADRKSTRLNSSHLVISYAVFCLKKKKQKPGQYRNDRHSKSDKVHETYSAD